MVWNVVSDITITNNLIKNCGRGLQLGKYNHAFESSRIQIANNLWILNATGTFGDGLQFVVTNESHAVSIEHNTLVRSAEGKMLESSIGPNNGLVYRNNVQFHGGYGVNAGGGVGSFALDAEYPGAVFEKNVMIGPWPSSQGVTTGHFSGHPDNFFPQGQANVGFVDYAGGDYALSTGSAYHNAATDGTDIGVDMDALNAAFVGEYPWPSPVGVTYVASPAVYFMVP